MNTGDVSYLRNDFELDDSLLIGGIYYPTVEHAFQAAKTTDRTIKATIAGSDVATAREIGKKISLPENWETHKLFVMESLLRAKFQTNEALGELLAKTHEELHMNNRKDLFWGCWDGAGQNHLGKILMKIRGEIQFLNPEATKEPTTLSEVLEYANLEEYDELVRDALVNSQKTLQSIVDLDVSNVPQIYSILSKFKALKLSQSSGDASVALSMIQDFTALTTDVKFTEDFVNVLTESESLREKCLAALKSIADLKAEIEKDDL